MHSLVQLIESHLLFCNITTTTSVHVFVNLLGVCPLNVDSVHGDTFYSVLSMESIMRLLLGRGCLHPFFLWLLGVRIILQQRTAVWPMLFLLKHLVFWNCLIDQGSIKAFIPLQGWVVDRDGFLPSSLLVIPGSGVAHVRITFRPGKGPLRHFSDWLGSFQTMIKFSSVF